MRSQALILAVSLALAASLTIALIAPAEAQTAARKFGRGIAGITCGFMELPGNVVKETNEQGAIGVPIGLAKGLGMIVARELIGVYELVSAPFPAPSGYRPILHPEYPWDYFE
ncbi:MAG: exosortase system-associated protein, TIGR04073 family [Rhodospirillales bacterium]|nr:exosortase system-associated protein, TIGR04073 family [Rhodospirillales bacterium]